MFTLENVSKKFGDEYALRDISMTIGKGLNFIIGSSGSGKTTLLKIITGMEQIFDGEAYYCGQSVKTLTENEKSYIYHNVFGFVWQDFNLLNDRTVLENVVLPNYLGDDLKENIAMKLLRELKISELATQKVSKLSGGQKQRVAIARELMKNPQVLIADEPTSALDEKSAKAIMDILRDIAKSRTVIVVTHDTSLIDKSAKVYEFDKGELISAPEKVSVKSNATTVKYAHKLTLGSGFKLSVCNVKCQFGRFVATLISLLVAATLLLVTVSGAILSSGNDTFDKLFKTYGEGILDINLVGSFMSASGTGGEDGDEPNANVSQDIGGLYDKYLVDERVAHIVFSQAFDEINVTVDGNQHSVKSSGNVPIFNKLTAGSMPMGKENEVVVPSSFVKNLGITDKEAIGKTITFNGSIYNWDSGEAVKMAVTTTATIVGVADTSQKYDSPNGVIEVSIDDSFFFSKVALDDMRKQAKIEKNKASFTIRTKTPADLIAIKDELNAQGIVPLGQFELVEDMVRLNNQTTEQSGSAVVIIGILSAVVALAVSLMTALSRRREYAIYKVSGFSGGHLVKLAVCETLFNSIIGAVVFAVISPLLNLATTALWSVNILNVKLLFTGMLLVIATGVFTGIVTALISSSTKASTALTTGER